MDDKADSFNIAITTDTSFYVGSNGTLDSAIYNGGTRETSYYTVRYPMATYLFSVAISVYTVWEDEWVYNGGADTMPVVHAVFPDRYTYSLPRWGIIPDALTVLSEAFGLYPFPEEKYGHANFTWGGGMEHQTMTSMTGNNFGFNQNVVVHELGHQWWGDMITCEQWGHIWLNEGWAVYSEALYWEWVGGWNSYHAYMDSIKYLGGGSIYIQDTSSVNNIFGLIVYDKGGWVMHMLRNVLGDSLFFATIDAYYNSPFRFGAATTEDFRDIAEATSGAELDWFFNQWIYGTSYPVYNWYDWTELGDTGGYDLHLRVRQVHSTNPQVFTMPIDVAVNYLGGGADTFTVWMDAREEIFRLHLDNNVTSVGFDPKNWILKTATHPTWKLFIITPNDDLSGATRYLPYVDTVETRGGSGSRTCSITSGSLPPGMSMNSNGVISGTCTDSGSYAFNVKVQDNNWSSYFDELPYVLNVSALHASPGDVVVDNNVDVSDLTYLVAFMFRQGPEPLDMNAADVNGTCTVDIADVTKLVAYMFKGGDPLVAGCVH